MKLLIIKRRNKTFSFVNYKPQHNKRKENIQKMLTLQFPSADDVTSFSPDGQKLTPVTQLEWPA